MAKDARQVKEARHRLDASQYEGRVCVSYTICVKSKTPIFIHEPVVREMKAILERSIVRYDCLAPVHCFMPDHLHVVATGTSDEARPNHAIYAFKQSAGFWLKKNLSHASLQKDFYDHIVRGHKTFKRHVFYVLCNPVRAGLIKDPFEYPFSGSIGVDLRELVFDVT